MTRGRKPSVTGRFETHDELVNAVLGTRQQGIAPSVAAPTLGITLSQYSAIIRPYTKFRMVPKLRSRGTVVVRRLGKVVEIEPEQLAQVLDYVGMLRLPAEVQDIVDRLRAIVDVREQARVKVEECK